MAIRFRSTHANSRLALASRSTQDGFGQWWAAVGIIAIGIASVLSLGGRSGPVQATHSGAAAAEEILASLRTAERALSEIDLNLASLCQDPVLAALELEPDCATGSMTLGDALFERNGGSQLTEAAGEDVRAAMTIYLENIRRMPALWESLEALEIRGHSDPRAMRDPYQTNMVGSQQRALGVLLFLVGPQGLSQQDREDLERLATVSGASSSRPPASCPESTRECFRLWRRVEIRPVLSESLRRGDWSRTIESVRVAARRASEKSGAGAE